MAQENDRPEDDRALPVEPDPPSGDDVARQRVLHYDASLKDCEHDDAGLEAMAAANSTKALERWEQSEPGTRAQMLDRVGREMMTVHETPPPELHPKELPPGLRGQYVDDDFRIDIDKNLLEDADPKDGLETYLHEYRHAEQAYEVQTSHGAMARDVDGPRASLLEANDYNYIEYKDNFKEYEQQISEADARQFSERAASEILKNRESPEK